jgi:LysR family hydrogen peroxide-inducible transcriptional activator
MEMHQLRYFARLAELGSFTRAAEACHVSQPSLSQQIAKLEKELGRPLFERLGRGARLTEAGRLFKEHVDQILSLLDDARASAADDPDAGRLVVAAIPTVAPYFLPPVLMRFAAECPRARIEVVEETTARILKLLADGEADIAVMALPFRGEAIHAEPLFTEELLAVVPATHPLARKPRLSLRDLAGEPFVLLYEAHCLTGNTLSFCNRHAVSPVVTARIHQLATVQELVRLGHGVSLAPRMAAAADGNPGRVYRSLSGDRPTRTVAMGWNGLRFRSKLFRRFIGALRVASAGQVNR